MRTRVVVFEWSDDPRRALAEGIRQRVFVEEQRCPPEEEWDGEDERAHHLLALIEEAAPQRNSVERAVGTARWREVAEGVAKLERFAVLPEARGLGIGAALVEATIADARAAGFASFTLNAQLQAKGLYERFGFEPVGAHFVEAGIEHVRMIRGGMAGRDQVPGTGDGGAGLEEEGNRGEDGKGLQEGKGAESSGVVFFDGHCPLCHGVVKFLLARDRARAFRFAPLEGETARRVLGEVAVDSDTVVLVLDPDGAATRLERSAAAVAMLRALPWPWSWIGRFAAWIPRRVADWGYRLIAANRTRLGRYETCPLPPPEVRERFLP